MRGYQLLAAARTLALAAFAGLLLAPGDSLAAAAQHPAGPSAASFLYNTSGSLNVAADPASVSGPATLQFVGIAGGTYTAASGHTMQLGQFVVPASTNTYGSPTTFTNTPFELQVTAPEFNKTTTVPLLDKVFPTLGHSLRLKTETDNSLLIKGVINGTVSATGQANLAATVSSVKLGGLDATTQDHITHYTFPIRFSQLKLPTTWNESLPAPGTTATPATATATATPAQAAAQVLLPGATSAAGTALPASSAETIVPTPIAIPVAAPAPVPTPEPSTFAIVGLGLAGLWAARRRRAR